jgi:hypothetical protein
MTEYEYTLYFWDERNVYLRVKKELDTLETKGWRVIGSFGRTLVLQREKTKRGN